MLPPDPKFLPHKASDTTPDHRSLPPGAQTQQHAPSPSAHPDMGPAIPPPALSAAPSLSSILHGFRRSWRLAVPVALLGGLLFAAAAWFIVPPQYTSAVVFRINQRPGHGSLEDEHNFANVQKAQTTIVKGFEVISETIRQSKVSELYGLNYTTPQLQKKFIVSYTEGPELMNVSFSGENPEAVAALLTALGEVYPRKVNSDDEARIKSRIAQLRRRLVTDPERNEGGRALNLAEQLRDKRIELAHAEKTHGLDDVKIIDAKRNEAQAMKSATEKLLTDKKLQRDGFEVELRSKRNRMNDPPRAIISTPEAEESLRGDPDYLRIQQTIQETNRAIDKWRVAREDIFLKQTEKYRATLRALEIQRQELIGRAKERLAARVDAVTKEQMRKDIYELEDKIEQAKKAELILEAELRRWAKVEENYRDGGPKAPPEVQSLRDQVTQLETEQKKVGEELASLEGSLPLNPRVTRVVDAFVPQEKEYARPLKYSVAAGILAFAGLLLGLSLLDANNRKVNASDDVIQGLGVRVIGTLPLIPSSARKKAASGQTAAQNALDSQFGMTEAVDAIRTVLMHAPRIDGARVVMVTSATGGEGKTTLASHLAASLARAWRKTLLIDGDVRNPAQHTQFQQPGEPGLCEALRGEVEFEDTIKPTPISRLWLMPAGQVDAHALQALAQDGVELVFERLKEQYDFIVLDTSPVLPVPDALLLGKHTDAVILSVMKDVSRIPAVYQANQKLESLGIRVLGAVVIGEKTETYGRQVSYPRA